MDPGRLVHQITVEQLEQHTGSRAALVPYRVRAAVEPLPPQVNDRQILHEVTIRYHAGVTLDTVVGFRGRELFVRGVQNVGERNVEMRLLCEEIVP